MLWIHAGGQQTPGMVNQRPQLLLDGLIGGLLWPGQIEEEEPWQLPEGANPFGWGQGAEAHPLPPYHHLAIRRHAPHHHLVLDGPQPQVQGTQGLLYALDGILGHGSSYSRTSTRYGKLGSLTATMVMGRSMPSFTELNRMPWRKPI